MDVISQQWALNEIYYILKFQPSPVLGIIGDYRLTNAGDIKPP
jgi:hypothetical protein